MTEADRRALTPLFWTHIYGRFDLDMDIHLDLDSALVLARQGSIPAQRSTITPGMSAIP
jgi:hypothetical protein